ncbi:MAG: aminopeptidase P family protein [Desulfobacteraceae bacterium]|nr:aminopeptidase P family protein [Desulfobacteraceae bacterium]
MPEYQKSTPETELNHRITNFQNQLTYEEIGGVLIIQKADMFYFSGTVQQGWLYIPAIGEPLLMVFKDYQRAVAESALEQVLSIVSPKKIPEILLERGCEIPGTLGLELDVLPANQYFMFQQIFDGAQIKDISTTIRLQRAIKSEYEIEKIKEASRLADQVAATIPGILEVGITEIELAGRIESHARRLGHQGLIRMRLWDNDLFYGHLMAGKGAAVPSSLASPTGGKGLNASIAQGPGFNKIKPNEPVLFDYVFCKDGYLSDHTRIFSIGGLPSELMMAHEAMLEIQESVKRHAVPGAVTGDLYELMVNRSKEKGYDNYFMGATDRKIRFTGHGIGIELDEFPFIAMGQKLSLEKSMVIALEPKAVIPGKGVVGIENTLMVTENGLESLTKFQDEIVIL